MVTAVDKKTDKARTNKAAATRFIHGFNDNDWDAVRDVVAPGFVFHHPLGGTVEAGPEGMVSTWAGFKELSPDSWHPIPVMIADGDYVAVLLPTYGTFTGKGEHAPPPTGGRLDYGMVNIVRLEDGKLVEMWFGMDSLVEMQQMGVAPPAELRQLDPESAHSLELFEQTLETTDHDWDTLTAFGDAVVTIGPPQASRKTSTRRIDVHLITDDRPATSYHHEMTTNPPYDGGSTADTDTTRGLVDRWVAEILNDHDTSNVVALVSDNVLIHSTAMPCEASHFGPSGAHQWLRAQWASFGDLAIIERSTVAQGDIAAMRWTARGISSGPFMGFAPTGKPVEFTGVTMYRVEGDRIAEIWDTRNTLGILHQLNPEVGSGGHHH